jgi:hypothetical protein
MSLSMLAHTNPIDVAIASLAGRRDGGVNGAGGGVASG